MRFDDRLTTVLAGSVPSGAGAVAQYRQLVDILGQIPGPQLDERHGPALARIHALRADVTEADRLLTIQCLSGRLVSPVLVQYLAAETPDVASAAIRAARLDDDQWAALVPALPLRARGFLRHRRDLGPATRRLLDQLGLYDTALPDAQPAVALAPDAVTAAGPPPLTPAVLAAQPVALTRSAPDEPALADPGFASESVPAAMVAGGPQSIGEIVKRIEALQEVRFRQAKDDGPAAAAHDWNQLGKAVREVKGAKEVREVREVKDARPVEAVRSVEAVRPPETAAVDAGAATLPGPAAALLDRQPPEHEHFRFSTGVDGAITAADGIALGAVYGLSLALPAVAGFRGVDAAVATAFNRRMPVRGGRANLGSAAGLGGEWRIDADPGFDRASGRFTGYAGLVRRPMVWESAGLPDDDTMLSGRDGLRQIVHELRTPLNAIMGFSEIIDQQLFGPVAAEYRDMASHIRNDARQLLSGFDDLDTALRLDRNAIDDPSGQVALADLVDRLTARVQPLLDHSAARLAVSAVPSGSVIAMSVQALDRIVPRLAGALIGSCQQGETLDLSFVRQADNLALRFSRPLSLAGLNEAGLFDVDRASASQGDGGPLLGLGFCLRLVRNLLASQGGALQVEPDALCLTLPCVQISAGAVRS